MTLMNVGENTLDSDERLESLRAVYQ